MRVLIILTTILIFAVNISAKVTATGASSATFDAIGSRSLALKESVTAIGSGAESISANPALISRIEKLNLSMMYLKWFADMNYIFFATAFPLEIKKFKGTLGLAITTFSSGDFEKFIEGSSTSEGNTSANDYNIAISYARNIYEDLQTGVNLKIIRSTLDEYSATAFAADIGIIYNLDKQIKELSGKSVPLLLGISVQNIGSSQKFISEGTPLPMNIKFGLGYNYLLMKNHNFMADLDFNVPNDGEFIARLGIEYSYIDKLNDLKIVSVRVGVQPTGRANNLFSVGVGSQLPLVDYLKDYQFSVDYAMIPLTELGYNHAITVSVIFKEDISKLFLGEEQVEEKPVKSPDAIEKEIEKFENETE